MAPYLFLNADSKIPFNSPVRQGPSATRSLTLGTTTIPQSLIRQEAMAEIDRLRVTSTADFLKSILPVEESVLDSVHASVVEKKLYLEGFWQAFPRGKKPKEKELYAPFVQVANAIKALALKVVEPNEDQVRECAWKDYHSQPPKSLVPDATKIRPDCVLAMGISAAAEAVQKDTSVPVRSTDLVVIHVLYSFHSA